MGSKNVNRVGAKNLRKLRNMLGVRQRDLECEGVPNVSQLETAAIAITDDVSAPALEKKIIEVASEKGIILPDDIKSNLINILLGKENIITNDILKKVNKEKDISLESIQDIDSIIQDLSIKELQDFFKDLIQVLSKKDMYVKINAKSTKKYVNKFLQLNLDNNTKIKAYRQLIRAYLGLRNYEEVVDIAESIEYDIDICSDKDDKCSCYSNIAFAYQELDNLNGSLKYSKKLKELGKYDEFFYLSLESDRYLLNNDFKEAEIGYLNILSKAKIKMNNDYIVDGYSSLAKVYTEMNFQDRAKENINEALKNITCGTSRVYKLNAYYTAFTIYDKYFDDNIEKIESFFWSAFYLAIELNNLKKLNNMVDKIVDRYLNLNKDNKIYEITSKLNGIKINPDILLKIIETNKKYL